jgi:hypothetical protein
MARRVFYSFHYKPDVWRTSQIRNAGIVDGSRTVTDNEWETVTRGGDAAIERWIVDQMSGKSCVVVLIGAETARRKWIEYEIKKAWEEGKGVVGIQVHNLKDDYGRQASKGANPFDAFNIDGVSLSRIVKSYEPPYTDSKSVYAHIVNNIEAWVDEAVAIRGRY